MSNHMQFWSMICNKIYRQKTDSVSLEVKSYELIMMIFVSMYVCLAESSVHAVKSVQD